MSGETKPNARQEEFANLPVGNVLLIAPAGCGKTEALAERARVLVGRGEIGPPRKILALTYSNKAKDNLSARMRALLGRNWRQWVTVTNFHGFATRLIQSHGVVIGMPPTVLLPERSRRAKRLRELGVGYEDAGEFERVLREAKSDEADDETVLQRIHESGHTAAIEFEQGLRSEGRIDYDDQIRHAVRLLAEPSVARLYQTHFVTVMVDEVQDLSMGQLRMVQAVGGNQVTYAGDPAQGIYSFAGAQSAAVFNAIRGCAPTEIEFVNSYRSSPAVLGAINGLARHMGITELECGAPDQWSDDGHVRVLRSPDTEHEAEALLELIARIRCDESLSIGVVARRSARMNDLRRAAAARGVDFYDWGAPTHVLRVVDLLKKHVPQAQRQDINGQIDTLERLCRESVDLADAETLDEIAAACTALREAVDTGATFAEAVAQCRSAPDSDAPVSPGLHLLTGHVGKGQEFDWVVVIGLEDGHVPDFRNTFGEELQEELRVLHVMVSRARYGLVITSANRTRTQYGWRDATPSPWFALLRAEATAEI